MLIVFHGQDISRRKTALNKLRDGLLKKRPAAEVFEMDVDEFRPGRLKELTSSRGLFEDKYIVFLYHVLSEDEHAETVVDRVDQMAETDHVFVVVEDELKKDHKNTFSNYAEKLKHFRKETDSKEHKPFPLSDAYGRRDKKKGWIELQKALKSPNNSPESIHGLLWWQTRLMWLAKDVNSAEEAGVSSYPFKKAKKFQKNFTEEKLFSKTNQLITMYHNAHRGHYDLSEALEQFILEV